MTGPRTPDAAASTREQSELDFARWLEEVDLERLDLARLAGDPAATSDDDDDERLD